MTDIVRITEDEKRRRVALSNACLLLQGTDATPGMTLEFAHQFETYLKGERDGD